MKQYTLPFTYANWAATSPVKLYSATHGRAPYFPRTGLSSDDFTMKARSRICSFFMSQDPRRVVFGSGSTDLLNKILWGRLWNKTGNVITTSLEHNSVLRPLTYISQRTGITVKTITPGDSGCIAASDIAGAIDSETRLIVITHASNVTGAIQPVQEITAAAHAKNIPVIIDCAQTGGRIRISAEEIDADALIFSAHKSLLGPGGLGFAILHKDFDVDPVFAGGSGISSELAEQPEKMPWKLEPGTLHYEGIFQLHDALDSLEEMDYIGKNSDAQDTFTRFLAELKGLSGYTVIGVPADRMISSVNIVPKTCFNVDELSYILYNVFSVVSRPGLHCAPLAHKHMGTYPSGTLRLSFGIFSSSDDYETTLTALKKIQRGL